MNIKNYKLFFILSPFFALPSYGMPEIKICDDDTIWPQFSFIESQSKKTPVEEKISPVGYSMDAVEFIFKKNKISYNLAIMRWDQCLQSVRNGTISMILDIRPAEEMGFIYSKPLYDTHNAVFFSKKYYPNGFQFKTVGDLLQSKSGQPYKICGFTYFNNYTPYNLADSDVNDVLTIDDAVTKLNHRECDYIFGITEIARGFKTTKYQSSRIDFEELAFVEPTPFAFAVSKKLPYAFKLVNILNKGIDDLNKSGMSQTLRKKWYE